jgi:hypothetical protein
VHRRYEYAGGTRSQRTGYVSLLVVWNANQRGQIKRFLVCKIKNSTGERVTARPIQIHKSPVSASGGGAADCGWGVGEDHHNPGRQASSGQSSFNGIVIHAMYPHVEIESEQVFIDSFFPSSHKRKFAI